MNFINFILNPEGFFNKFSCITYLFDCSSGQEALMSSDGCSVLTLFAPFGDGEGAILLSQWNYKCIYTYIHISGTEISIEYTYSTCICHKKVFCCPCVWYFIIVSGDKTKNVSKYEMKISISNILGSVPLLLSVDNQFCLFEKKGNFCLLIITLSVFHTC